MPRSQWIANLQWVRPAQQSRSQQTLSRLLNAAEEIIAEQGIEGMTVAAVARRAEKSVGSLYHHFRDKASLINAIFQRMHREFTATLHDAVDPNRWRGASIAEVLHGYLQFSEEVYRNRPAQLRTMFALGLHQADFQRQMEQINQQLGSALRFLLQQRVEEINHPKPSIAIAFALDQLHASIMLRQNTERLGQTLSCLSGEEFIDQALTACCAYLQIAPSRKPTAQKSG